MTEASRDESVAAQIRFPLEIRLEHDESDWTLVMRRRFPHTPARLWQMITEPELLARWSPVVPDRPLDSPGPATCREKPEDEPLDAEVLIADRPRKLVHRWDAEILSWTITSGDDGTTLELRQSLGDHPRASQYAAGWHLCLARLAVEDDGFDHERVVGGRAWAYGCGDLIERYRDVLGSDADDVHPQR
ncbi:SRPBCC domain-containing protein [Microbacterium sp.]|uniref:SRPBCC domain-containing protein n=1 Tax=Microbacterium sp. TaxID=51671 RepID=UPI002811851A|nr:SRPBCC domain-containing protein [Microbacterium sp.]